jgi:hypothetical protein
METSNIYTLYAIISGLIGSVLTVIVSKILDIIQQSREHRYSIQKTFFTKN